LPIVGVVAVHIEGDEFRAAEPTGKTQQQDRAVAQTPQIMGQGGHHGEDVGRIDSGLLSGRACLRLMPCRTVAM
jgi:hypothetical protein